MNRLMALLLFFIVFSCFSLKAALASASSGIPGEMADAVDFSELKAFLTTVDEDIQKYLPRLDPKSWGAAGPEWNFSAIGKGILKYFLRELFFNYKLIGQLILVALALAILENMRHAFEGDSVNRLASSLCFLVIMGIVLNCFRVTFMVARETLSGMVDFVYAITPVLFSLIAAGGGVVTTTIVHPLLVSSVGIIEGLISNLVFPLIMFAGILEMVNHLDDNFQVNKLTRLLKVTAVGILGLAMAVFIGLITVRGFAASVADSLALRTAKYFSTTFLPVVGGAISDTMEMAAGCATVLKNGLGVYGLGMITLITAFPLLKMLAIAVIFQIAGAITQPLGNNRLADALQAIGDTFLHLFGTVTVAGLMFYIALAVLVGVANFGIR